MHRINQLLAARYAARNVVDGRPANYVEVQVMYAIGVVHP